MEEGKSNKKMEVISKVIKMKFPQFLSVSLSTQQQETLLKKVITKIDQIIQKIKQTCRIISRDNTLQKYFKEAQTTKEQVVDNIIKATLSLQTIQTFLKNKVGSFKAAQKVVNYLHQFFQKQSFNTSDQLDRINWIFDMENKLKAITQFMDSFLDFKDNIVTLPSRNYIDVWRNIHINHIGNLQKINSQKQIIKLVILAATAAIIEEVKFQGWLTKKVVFGLSYSKHLINYKRSTFQCLSYYRKPSVEITKKVWNLGQSGTIMNLQKVLLPSISYNEELFIPYHVQKDSYPNIRQNKNGSGERVKVRLLSDVPIKFYHKAQGQYVPVNNQPKNKDIDNQNEKWKQKEKLNQKQKQKQNQSPKKSKEIHQTILIYINGGGFIALTSFTMQTYTRKWAKELGIPVFSIDYRKPPEHRFPQPIQDAYIAYRFITERVHQYMNIKPKKIILAGDSAGGNIICSLMGIILKEKLTPVHSMFLAYPAIDTRKVFSPSRINCFEDPILYPSLLILCIKQYLGDLQKHHENPYASPILFTQQDFGGQKEDKRWPLKWPKTTIMVGKKDPLYDDSIIMMQKMISSKIQCHCQVYENFGHGFLSMQQAISDCPQLIKDSIKFLKDLIL